jgi:hypothetical protein
MTSAPPVSFDSTLEPDQFLDSELRSFVKRIPVGTGRALDVQPESKRRKTGLPQTLPRVTNLLWKLVGSEPQDTLAGYSNVLSYVNQNLCHKTLILMKFTDQSTQTSPIRTRFVPFT